MLGERHNKKTITCNACMVHLSIWSGRDRNKISMVVPLESSKTFSWSRITVQDITIQTFERAMIYDVYVIFSYWYCQ